MINKLIDDGYYLIKKLIEIINKLIDLIKHIDDLQKNHSKAVCQVFPVIGHQYVEQGCSKLLAVATVSTFINLGAIVPSCCGMGPVHTGNHIK